MSGSGVYNGLEECLRNIRVCHIPATPHTHLKKHTCGPDILSREKDSEGQSIQEVSGRQQSCHRSQSKACAFLNTISQIIPMLIRHQMICSCNYYHQEIRYILRLLRNKYKRIISLISVINQKNLKKKSTYLRDVVFAEPAVSVHHGHHGDVLGAATVLLITRQFLVDCFPAASNTTQVTSAIR
jgi:hypothetical protein